MYRKQLFSLKSVEIYSFSISGHVQAKEGREITTFSTQTELLTDRCSGVGTTSE